MFPLRKAKRVLLLDDDKAIHRLVSTLLRRAGFRVDVVDRGSKAIEALSGKNPYAVILLDLMMPTEGGVTVVRHLREKNPALLERVLLLTSTPESVLKNIERDIAGVVRKPFTRDELIDAVKRVAKS
jgi:CheY-like chemotaxis protein